MEIVLIEIVRVKVHYVDEEKPDFYTASIYVPCSPSKDPMKNLVFNGVIKEDSSWKAEKGFYIKSYESYSKQEIDEHLWFDEEALRLRLKEVDLELKRA